MPAVWNPQANAIFLKALEQPPTEREPFLQQACGQDASLAEQVRALLASSDQAGCFLESPPTAVAKLAETAKGRAAGPPRLSFLAPSEIPDSLGRLGHYIILGVVGSGGFGVVLKARDEKLQRIVAVKTLAETLAASGAARQRFVREAIAAAAVRHENVVAIHAVDDEGPVPFLVMEYVEGQSLQSRLDKTGSLTIPEILRIGLQIAEGLAAAHQQGLIHRDVKPANILLENGVPRVKITDFGLARLADDAAQTVTGLIAGTPAYMSPEQARGEAIDHRSDLFSLGSVLYAMCTGQSPFRGSTTLGVIKRVCEEQPRPIRDLNSDIPEWLCGIIERLHAKCPDERYRKAAEAAEDLRRGLSHVQGGASQPASQEPEFAIRPHRAPEAPGRTIRRWFAPAVAVALLLTLMFTLAEAGGVTQLVPTVIRIVTGEGTLLVETSDPDVKVTIEGDGGLVITGAGPQDLRIRPGTYRIKAAKDGRPLPLDSELVTVTRGGVEVVRVTLEAKSTAGTIENGSIPAVPEAAATEATLREAIRLMPRDSENHKRLGEYLDQHNRLPDAEAAYREAIRLVPSESHYYVLLGGVLLKQPDRYTDGIAELERARNLSPNYAYINSRLGDAYANLGRWREAAAPIRRNSDLTPSEHWGNFKHATLSLYLGDLENYRIACQRLLDAHDAGKDDDPDNTATVCLLSPGGIGQDERVRQIALDGRLQQGNARKQRNARALAELRAGHWHSAIDEVGTFNRDLLDPFGAQLRLISLAILAMAQKGSGDRPAAMQTLANAKALRAATWPNPEQDRYFKESWSGWL
ncbi:MAG TPA: serine/threonine-protein kinase, partial [Pirellulaceae bacterium]|nr:serine/threonine-protein kinase [Pirellulaceae bacterium]